MVKLGRVNELGLNLFHCTKTGLSKKVIFEVQKVQTNIFKIVENCSTTNIL